jgi:hypothetical protein
LEANQALEDKAKAFKDKKESTAYKAAFFVRNNIPPPDHSYNIHTEQFPPKRKPISSPIQTSQVPPLPTSTPSEFWPSPSFQQWQWENPYERHKGHEQRSEQGFQRWSEQRFQRNIPPLKNRRLPKHKSANVKKTKINNLLLEYQDNILSLQTLGVVQPEIHNISSKVIHPELTEALLLGHKFIPTTKNKPEIIQESMKYFSRSTRLKWFFKDEEDNEIPEYWIPSDWSPPIDSYHPTIESGLKRLEFNLNIMTGPKIHNISPKQRQNLTKLLEDPDIIIVTADKNLGYVITDTTWYEQACLNHLLSNSYVNVTDTFYQDGTCLATINFLFNELCTKVTEYTENFTITPAEAKWICKKPDDDKFFSPSSFYILPKIHKQPYKGRPIVPSMTWLTFHLSEWIANQLNPLVIEFCPNVLRDSTQLVQDLTLINSNNIHTFNYTILSADVEALYPNMDIQTGLDLIRTFLDDINWHSPERRNFLLWAMEFTLTKGYIYFKGMVFQQTNGAAMGSPMIPPYANIFMHMLEKDTISTYHQEILLYKRFIDDVFLITKNDPTTIQTIQNALNNLKPFINFIWTPPSLKIDFLDITIINDLKHSNFKTNTFQKPLNKYSYLPYKSYHTPNMKTGFIKGEAIRHARLCSRKKDFNKMISLFTIRLQRRGYPLHIIQNSLKQVKFNLRAQYISTKNKQNKIPYIFKILYNPKVKHWKLREELNNFSHRISKITNLPKTLKQKITICYSLPPPLHKKILKARKDKDF